jgi:hypothetical protein
LFIFDSAPGDQGSIIGGWSMNITTIPEPSAACLLGLAAVALLAFRGSSA